MRSGQLIRVNLSDAEWARVKQLAAQQHLNASQLVSQTLRENLLQPTKGRAT